MNVKPTNTDSNCRRFAGGLEGFAATDRFGPHPPAPSPVGRGSDTVVGSGSNGPRSRAAAISKIKYQISSLGKKYCAAKYFLFILLSCTCTSAMLGTNESGGLRAQTLDTALVLLTKPLGDAVALRWAPADYGTWRRMQLHGVLVERRRLGDKTGFQPLGERIRAFSLNDIRGLADTNNVHVVAVAEALYGESEPGERKGEMGAALDVHQEQQQRLFLAYVNADLSPEAARCLGWAYTDRTTQPGVPYEYRLRLPDPEGERLSPPVRRRCTDHYDTSPPDEFRVVPDDGKVTLHWSGNDARRFAAYHPERSTDGGNWERLLDVPLWLEPGPEEFSYPVTVEREAPNYRYRLRGTDAFGWVSPPTAAVEAVLPDRTPPNRPLVLRGEGLPGGVHELRWLPAAPQSPDLAGYHVLRGPTIDGPFKRITTRMLPASATVYRDTEPPAGRTSFYTVEAIDGAGNWSRSPVNFVRPHDDTPPATPRGLTGRIDSLGRVVLLWEPGVEPDLLGYRVYRSHARDREFLQITKEVQHRNFFFDSTTLLVLDETVLYRIVAVDQHYNPSEYSEILELRRPDKIAPTAPVITRYSATATGVDLEWRPSESRDVVRQTLWRAENDGPARPLVALAPTATTYLDTSAVARRKYTYTVRSEDEAGLFATSTSLSVRGGALTSYAPVTDLARTWLLSEVEVQLPGESKEAMTWTPPAAPPAAYLLFGGPAPDALRPLRKLPAAARSWMVTRSDHYYAIRALYPGGGRSPLSAVVGPVKR